MKTGIFGGSFNPFHIGHKKALKAFIRELSLDRVFVIPTAIPPHKEAEKIISDEERLKIVELSVSDIDNVFVSDWEIKNGGKSYTYLTLEYFKKTYPEDEFYLYVGSDMFLTLNEWKYPEKIIKKAVIAAFSRESDDNEAIEKQKIYLEKEFGAKCFIGKIEPIIISSTEIRKKLRNSENISEYLDKKAAEYIEKKHLYSLPSNDKIISVIKTILSPSRFEHSIGVCKEIKELALIYGYDTRKAEVCGLLHDITKNFPNEWHLDFIKKNNIETDENLLKYPLLYHALTGSIYIKQIFGINDPEIISAIRYHTTAKPQMSLLEKLIYVSDFTEPTRKYADVDFYRTEARKNINRALALGLIWNIENLRSRNQPVYKDSLEAAEFYRRYI